MEIMLTKVFMEDIIVMEIMAIMANLLLQCTNIKIYHKKRNFLRQEGKKEK